jgi:hypothetical protein
VLCLIVVPLAPGENPFAVKINNNNNKPITHILWENAEFITKANESCSDVCSSNDIRKHA